MTGITCHMTRRKLSALPDGSELGTLEAHFTTCLRCQVEAARYRRLVRSLAELADVHEHAPVGLAAAVERTIAGPRLVPAPAGPRPAAVTVAAMLGAAAATAGTMVLVRMLKARSAA